MMRIKGMLVRLFPPPEIKEIRKSLKLAEKEINNKNFHLIKDVIEQGVNLQSEEISKVIAQGKTSTQWVYMNIVLVARDLLGIGDYHIYRGVINPMGPGNALLQIHKKALEKLMQIKAISINQVKEENKMLENDIKNAG
ncbi:MAG: hypothetical protein V1668_00940 [Patescibacteria group bacterium]